MKPTFSFLFIATALLLFNSCKDNGSEPQERKIKSPLDMTWTYEVLTSDGIQLMLTSMYAANYKDIWLTGHNSEGNKALWHYNGVNWVSVDPLAGNEPGAYSLSRLFGFAGNNIWLAGGRFYGPSINEITKPLIMNYNGTRWVEHKLDLRGRLLAIGGDSPTNIWACGYGSLVLHYDGSKWLADTIKIKGVNPEDIWYNSVQIYNGKPFFLGNENDLTRGINTFYITGEIDNWTITDSLKTPNGNLNYTSGDTELFKSNEGRLYSYGHYGVWEMLNNKWVQKYFTTHWIFGFCALNENYMIAVGSNTSAAYYDGKTWTKIPQIKNNEIVQLVDVWTDGTEVFIIGYTGGPSIKTYIWHGK